MIAKRLVTSPVTSETPLANRRSNSESWRGYTGGYTNTMVRKEWYASRTQQNATLRNIAQQPHPPCLTATLTGNRLSGQFGFSYGFNAGFN